MWKTNTYFSVFVPWRVTRLPITSASDELFPSTLKSANQIWTVEQKTYIVNFLKWVISQHWIKLIKK